MLVLVHNCVTNGSHETKDDIQVGAYVFLAGEGELVNGVMVDRNVILRAGDKVYHALCFAAPPIMVMNSMILFEKVVR